MTLDVLFPEGKAVDAGGETLTLTPFKFGQYPKALKLMIPLVSAFKASGILGLDTEGNLVISSDWMVLVDGAVSLLAEVGDPMIDLCALATGKPREWLENISADEGVSLLRGVFEVNSDFFEKRIAPKLGLSVKIAAADGSTPSTDSSV